MSCCLCKSGAEYAQIAATNSMKTAAHICAIVLVNLSLSDFLTVQQEHSNSSPARFNHFLIAIQTVIVVVILESGY